MFSDILLWAIFIYLAIALMLSKTRKVKLTSLDVVKWHTQSRFVKLNLLLIVFCAEL